MFNSTNVSYRGGDVTNTLKINACSGGIYKTYKESWFQRFNLKSDFANELFNNFAISDVRTGEFYSDWHSFSDTYEINYKKPKHKKEEVIILQMVICGDMEVIAELIKKEDFDKYFQKENIDESFKRSE